MIWLFAIVSVSLVAILIQLLLVYQKKAYDLRMRQERIRKKIHEHISNLQETTKNIRHSASEQIGDLEAAQRIWAERLRPLTKELEELEKLMPPSLEANDEDPIDDSSEKLMLESDEVRLRELLDKIKAKQLELDGNLSGIERDTGLVRRTLEQMETNLKQVPSGGKG